MSSYDVKTRNFQKAKDAALWLLKNTDFKFSAIYHFFDIHPNSLTNWKKQLTTNKIVAPTSKNDYVEAFLKSKFNNSNYKKFNYIDVDLVAEIKWIIQNYDKTYQRFVIAQFYEIDDNYVSQLKSGYAWESINAIEPTEIRKKEIITALETIDQYIREEIQTKKKAAAWLLLFTDLELYKISHLLDLNYLHVYRLYLQKKNNKIKLVKLSDEINNIVYNYDFKTGEYHYHINYKYKKSKKEI